MQAPQIFTLVSIFLVLILSVCTAQKCSSPPKTIVVSQSGKAKFKTIQSAIDSIPEHNTQWIHIQISAGTYTEKVQISPLKTCIFLEGAGSLSTIIQWNDHQQMSTSATFVSSASDVVAKGITFKNTYNGPLTNKDNVQALAAKIEGDRNAFFQCAFKGVQDTLYDNIGRHYYYKCHIQGAIDFVFGDGQSIYEQCNIFYTVGSDGGPKGLVGAITAQRRNSSASPTGFVFKNCRIAGIGKTYLGRPWGLFSRVIIANSYMSDVVDPKGWNAWDKVGHEKDFTYVEEGCTGAGANKSKRVPWLKHLGSTELNKFLDISYIDQDGWISRLPTH